MGVDIAVDLGTANTLIYVRGQGIVLNEPSIVAKSKSTSKVIAVGNEAKRMVGKVHQEIETIRPLRDGVIADFEMADSMLQGFLNKLPISKLARPRMIICVPSGITEVEKRAVKESAERRNAREVFLIEEPVAAAIGIGIDISEPVGNMIVDIGGGTTEIAIIALNGIVTKESLRVAGDEMDEAIIQHFKRDHNLLIGERTAESIKMNVGSALQGTDYKLSVKGRNMIAGIPKTIEVSSSEIRDALRDTIDLIVDAVKMCLERTPPELSSDLLDRGIILTGGGALLQGFDKRMRLEVDLPVNVAEYPLLSIVQGTGKVLDAVERFEDVLY
ncbi:MAG: rod shape-determining protein [Candidatus Marinimicrobia bacterium]|nr:rod shape-determining protein [Candidatus Neomarinimicrobiota bacterium]MBT3576275.1 rod shape-determining protein [Candidatus Neomarinimicrobiota bacterium]MBT3680818.1 rod shape-determining protein [Candidatus Neomarinimicrobiota bacterium]MBT3950733.1 rod shape-determining protein [Candidatus Neomarinimicrobiota bacterium]MBT4252311.1 rod shape-determining protein [Candidatus Neomarinimicrobiota bacterium]